MRKNPQTGVNLFAMANGCIQHWHDFMCCIGAMHPMNSMGWPKGLVSYTSERAQKERKKPRLTRPKIFGYAAILVLSIWMLSWSIQQQAPFDLSVSQVRQPIYVRLSDGRIQNSYEIKVKNKTNQPIELKFSLQGLQKAELDMGPFGQIRLQPQQRLRLTGRVKADPDGLEGKNQTLAIIATPLSDGLPTLQYDSAFYPPKG